MDNNGQQYAVLHASLMPFFTSSGAVSLPESNAKHCCIDSPGEDNDYDYDYNGDQNYISNKDNAC